MARVTVVGATTWGTTLAVLLARQGNQVALLARTEEEAESLRRAGETFRFLPGIKYPAGLAIMARAEEALGPAEAVLIAVPSNSMRRNARAVRHGVGPQAVVVSASKGLELPTGKRMSQVLEEELPPQAAASICALSGPNLASEMIHGKPSSTVVASRNADAAVKVQRILNSPRLRVYTNDDVVGVELGGALKNIIAIGAGICDGLELGDNAKAAFITRGLAEITRLGVAAGASPLTFAGLAGMGDLVATCSSRLSRNHTVGRLLAAGRTLGEIRGSMSNVAEGVDTTAAALRLSESMGVDMPITRTTHHVLFDGLKLDAAIAELMGRAPSPE